MPDLKRLEGYNRESTDELIALESTHRVVSIVNAFHQAIEQKAARLGDDALTAEERVVLAVEALEREVNNGGYSQFFSNSSNEYLPIIVEALERSGCHEAAKLTRTAIDAVGIDPARPGLSDAMQKLPPDVIETLEQCDARYYADVGDLAEPLFEFVKKERARIVLS